MQKRKQMYKMKQPIHGLSGKTKATIKPCFIIDTDNIKMIDQKAVSHNEFNKCCIN